MKKIKYAGFLLILTVFFSACASPKFFENSAEQERYNDMAKEAYTMEDEGGVSEEKYRSTDVEYAGEADENPEVFAIRSPSRKLVKTVDLSLESKEFNKQLDLITEEIAKSKGYIEYSNIKKNSIATPAFDSGRNFSQNTLQYANLTARIPVEKLNSFVDFLAENTNILSKTEYVDDVTLQYIDTESRKKSLEVERETLWKLLENADNIDSIIAIQTRLSAIRTEMENYESQLRLFDNQVEYSTVNIELREVKDYQTPPAEDFQERITQGLKKSLKNFKKLATEFLIFLIINSPFILTAIIILLILKLLIRRGGKKRIKNKKVSSGKTEKTIQNTSNSSIPTQPETSAPTQTDTVLPKEENQETKL